VRRLICCHGPSSRKHDAIWQCKKCDSCWHEGCTSKDGKICCPHTLIGGMITINGLVKIEVNQAEFERKNACN
jgi:hypothetical protein